jgi:hypothetical protein
VRAVISSLEKSDCTGEVVFCGVVYRGKTNNLGSMKPQVEVGYVRCPFRM